MSSNLFGFTEFSYELKTKGAQEFIVQGIHSLVLHTYSLQTLLHQIHLLRQTALLYSHQQIVFGQSLHLPVCFFLSICSSFSVFLSFLSLCGLFSWR